MKIFISYFLITIILHTSLLAAQDHAVVLQYHRFDEPKYPSTNISMELFTKQINYLIQHNYNIWPLSKIIRYLLKNKKIPDKTVSITIDDAYQSVYVHAYPLLKKYNLPFTVFVNSLPIVHESKNYMSWNAMREMGKNGAEFANHSYSHQYLVREKNKNLRLYKEYVNNEIEKCEVKIEKELGNKVCTTPKIFAYPFGEYDSALVKILKNLGYIGVAQNSAPVSNESNFMALTRFPMSGGFGKMDSFVLKINTLPLPVKSTKEENTIVNKQNNPPVLVLNLQKPLKDLQCFTSDGKKIIMEWLSDTTVRVQSELPLEYPRNHYTCTAHAKGDAWYWYSHLWVILKEK